MPQGLLRTRKHLGGIPNTGGMNGVNVADCWVLPQGISTVEMTIAVTNATQVRLAVPSTFQRFLFWAVRNCSSLDTLETILVLIANSKLKI